MGYLAAENQALALVTYPYKGAVVSCWVDALPHCQVRSDTHLNPFPACSVSCSRILVAQAILWPHGV